MAHLRHTLVFATPNRTKESCFKVLLLHYYLLVSTKVLVNLPIAFKIKLPYLARGNGGVVYVPTVRLTLLYIECLPFHVSPTRKPVIFLGPCGNDTLARFPLGHSISYSYWEYLPTLRSLLNEQLAYSLNSRGRSLNPDTGRMY